ncbi:hypothetical protein [uncultured Dokdonia sp.]|uniref:hypothetical protein n=1 Tax=uncultured Dokdonia sp. TaxID=575653 RepID=UPI00260FA02F|nr:hypothetical protein [uncultured Dokdonia sp.]
MLQSCNKQSKIDKRDPFEVNHKLSCEGLIENGYKRLWGDDVVLISKEIGDTLIYYQLEYDQEEIEPDIGYIDDDHSSILIPEGSKEFYSKLCDEAYIYFRNFKLKLDKDKSKALLFLKSIDTREYKIITNQSLYPQEGEYFEVLNLKTLDTFHCSVTREKGYWYFQSSITFKKW